MAPSVFSMENEPSDRTILVAVDFVSLEDHGHASFVLKPNQYRVLHIQV